MGVKANVDLVMVSAGCQGPGDKNHVPLGLLYVGSELERRGYDVKIWHLLPDEFEAALPGIREREPLWVGLSVLSGMTTYYAAHLSVRLREQVPGSSIVWGGHHASALPAECVREDYVDYVIHGEGEDTAAEFSDALLSGSDLSRVLGLAYKGSEGQPVVNPPRPWVTDIDRHEIHWELVDMRQYMRTNTHGKRPVAFYSSRGCPYRCAFCATPSYTGSSYRAHSPDFVVRNLSYLKAKYGFDSVLFSDDNFMIDAKRGSEIVDQLSMQGISIDTIDVRVNQLNDAMVARFQDHGVNGVFFGYESGNDRILGLMNKGIDVEQIRRKAGLLRHHNVTAWASGIIGVPTETRDEVHTTIDFSMWLRDNLAEGSTVSLYRYMPLPKTQLLALALQEGFEYPRATAEWKVIDPIGPYYRMSGWLKWMTRADEEYLATIQEASRSKMFDYIHSHSALVNAINNVFVHRARQRAKARSYRYGLEFQLFDFARRIYSKAKYGREAGLRSQALESYK